MHFPASQPWAAFCCARLRGDVEGLLISQLLLDDLADVGQRGGSHAQPATPRSSLTGMRPDGVHVDTYRHTAFLHMDCTPRAGCAAGRAAHRRRRPRQESRLIEPSCEPWGHLAWADARSGATGLAVERRADPLRLPLQ